MAILSCGTLLLVTVCWVEDDGDVTRDMRDLLDSLRTLQSGIVPEPRVFDQIWPVFASTFRKMRRPSTFTSRRAHLWSAEGPQSNGATPAALQADREVCSTVVIGV